MVDVLLMAAVVQALPDEQQEFEWIRGARFARRSLDVPVPAKEDTSHVTEG